MLRNVLFILIVLMCNTQVFPQQNLTYWQAGLGYGSILRHRPTMSHLITHHPALFTLGRFRQAENNSPDYVYNYPGRGWVLLHQSFINENLGHVTSLNYTLDYYLRERNNPHTLNLQTGIGLGYASRPLDFETNNRNITISSHFNISVLLRLLYRIPVGKHTGLQTGITFTHFSNSSFRQPNLGINSMFVTAGMTIDPIVKQRFVQPENLPSFSLRSRFYTSLTFSLHEVKAKMGTHPVFVWTNKWVKRLSRKSGVQAGGDLVYSFAYKDLAEFLAQLNGTREKDFKQVDVFAGYHLFFNRWYLDTRLGFYLYNPLNRTGKVFEYVGMNYRFPHSRWEAGFGIKANLFKADFTGISIYYLLY